MVKPVQLDWFKVEGWCWEQSLSQETNKGRNENRGDQQDWNKLRTARTSLKKSWYIQIIVSAGLKINSLISPESEARVDTFQNWRALKATVWSLSQQLMR